MIGLVEDNFSEDLIRVGDGVTLLSGWDDTGGGATNRLLLENGDGLLLEDSSGDLALE